VDEEEEEEEEEVNRGYRITPRFRGRSPIMLNRTTCAATAAARKEKRARPPRSRVPLSTALAACARYVGYVKKCSRQTSGTGRAAAAAAASRYVPPLDAYIVLRIISKYIKRENARACVFAELKKNYTIVEY